MKATLILLETMDDEHKIQVQAEPRAIDIIRNLDLQYENATASNKHRFFTCRKLASGAMNTHIGKVKEMKAELINLGEIISDEIHQVILINSLPEEYSDLKRA